MTLKIEWSKMKLKYGNLNWKQEAIIKQSVNYNGRNRIFKQANAYIHEMWSDIIYNNCIFCQKNVQLHKEAYLPIMKMISSIFSRVIQIFLSPSKLVTSV